MDTTALIKTFLRDEYLFACIESLLGRQPGMPVIVFDDGYPSKEKEAFMKKHNVAYYHFPFATMPLTKARNEMVKLATTEYVLIGDDDFYYTPDAGGLHYLLDRIREDDVDLVAGRISEKGEIKNFQGFIRKEGKKLIVTPTQEHRCDLVFNYFVARRTALEAVRWDENIKVAYEHEDFFIRFKDNNYTVAWHPDAVVVHKPEGFGAKDSERETLYAKYRLNREDKDYFYKKHGITQYQDINNFTETV